MKVVPAVVLLVAALGAALAQEPPPPPSEDAVARALDLLHDGRFDEAEAVLGPPAGATDDVRTSFFRAFTTYWRLLYDDDDDRLQAEFERRLDITIAAGERRLDAGDDDPDVALWTGSARLLLAQLRAAQKKPFAAAFEAKRSKRLLDLAANGPGATADEDFGLGTYQYYADRVPAIVKGLRFLLNIPGGDRDRGLARLERAAAESRHFGLEARILLATIYSNRYEEMFDAAVREADLALAEHPDRIAVLHAAAVIDLSLGRVSLALDRLDRALARAARHPGTAPAVVATLRYHAARAELARYRPDLALDRLRPLVEHPETVPGALADSVRRIAGRARILSADPPPWVTGLRGLGPIDVRDPAEIARLRRAAESLRAAREALALEASGHDGGAVAALAELADGREAPDGALALLTARALLREDRAEEAHDWALRAIGSPDLPHLWERPAWLLAGLSSDRLGHRDDALRWYRKVTDGGHSFPGRDAAILYQGRTWPGPSAGDVP